MNNRPVYRKHGHGYLYLAHASNETGNGYTVPWTMWGGPDFTPGEHIANIKFGLTDEYCPSIVEPVFDKVRLFNRKLQIF